MDQDTLNHSLLLAAKENDWPLAKKLIEQGADILFANPGGWTAAHYFANHSNDWALENLMVANPAVLEQQLKTSGCTPANMLANCNNNRFVFFAKQYPCILRHRSYGTTPTLRFAYSGNVDVVIALAKIDPSVLQQRAGTLGTAAHLFAFKRDAWALSQLAAHYPEVLQQRAKGKCRYPLHILIRQGRHAFLDIKQLLEDHPKALYYEDTDHTNALMLLGNRPYHMLLSMIIKPEHVRHRNSNGDTILSYVRREITMYDAIRIARLVRPHLSWKELYQLSKRVPPT